MLFIVNFYFSGVFSSRNFDEVFTHMALMSLRSRSHVKTSIVLTRADHYLYKTI